MGNHRKQTLCVDFENRVKHHIHDNQGFVQGHKSFQSKDVAKRDGVSKTTNEYGLTNEHGETTGGKLLNNKIFSGLLL